MPSAISVPTHWTAPGLPLGVQFVGRLGADGDLFAGRGDLIVFALVATRVDRLGELEQAIANGEVSVPPGDDPRADRRMAMAVAASPSELGSTLLGVLGMPGFTAYMGLLDIGQPQAGETLVVAAASGAVGSVVGQIGKLKGCRVVGVAGGAEKCRYVVEELGFDACIDHRAPDFAEQLAAAKVPFIFDPGQGLPMFDGPTLARFIKQADWVTVNDYESSMLRHEKG